MQPSHFKSDDAGFQALSQVMELHPMGVVLVGHHRRIEFLNSKAQELIRDSKLLFRSGHTLRSQLDTLEYWLDTCIRMIESPRRVDDASISDAFHANQGRERINLLARRIAGSDERPNLCCLFVTSTSQKFDHGAKNLASLYGLSSRETTAINHLICGLSVPEIAQKMSISQSTVQTFVKRIHQKTGLSRKSEIVALGQSLNIGKL